MRGLSDIILWKRFLEPGLSSISAPLPSGQEGGSHSQGLYEFPTFGKRIMQKDREILRQG